MPRVACVLAILLVSAAAPGATAHAGPTWPRDGVCVQALERRPCATITAADAAQIQDAMLVDLGPARLRAEPWLGAARALAERPVRDGWIGGFHLVTTRLDATTQPAREILHVAGYTGTKHHSITAQLTRVPGGWRVLSWHQVWRYPRRN